MPEQTPTLASAPALKALSLAPEPRWLEDHPVLGQARLYLHTFRAFASGPFRFGRGWAEGALEAMNPLTFMATSAALLGLMSRIAAIWVKSVTHDGWETLAESAAPYAYYAIVGVGCHMALRPFGARRSWRTSLAIALFSGGTLAQIPMLLVRAATFSVLWQRGMLGQEQPRVESLWIALLGAVPLVAFFVGLGLGLAGALSVRRRVALLVVLAPMIATSFLPDRVPIPVPHVHLSIDHPRPHSWRYGLSVVS